jgi:hypothetical protein
MWQTICEKNPLVKGGKFSVEEPHEKLNLKGADGHPAPLKLSGSCDGNALPYGLCELP